MKAIKSEGAGAGANQTPCGQTRQTRRSGCSVLNPSAHKTISAITPPSWRGWISRTTFEGLPDRLRDAALELERLGEIEIEGRQQAARPTRAVEGSYASVQG